MKRGDRLEVRSPGGGGYGEVENRDPAAAEKDRLEEYFGTGKSVQAETDRPVEGMVS